MSCGALAARELPFWRDQLAGPDPSVQIATELDEEHLDPNHPGETRLRQAFRAYERFQYAHARRHFEAYLAAGGEGAYARYILARISAGEKALEHINRSVELAPDESEFSAYRIAVLRRLEQYAPIEDFIHNRLHQFYSSANVELETARYFQQRNQNARALFHYERARSVFDPLIDDSDLLAQALRGAGILRYQRGDFRQARARFEHIPPGSVPIPTAYYQATRIYLSNLQGEPALQILTRLNALPPRYRQRHAAIFEALPAALAVAYYLTDDVRFQSAYRQLENPDALIRVMHAEKNGAHDRALEMLAPVRTVRSFVRNQPDFPSLALLVYVRALCRTSRATDCLTAELEVASAFLRADRPEPAEDFLREAHGLLLQSSESERDWIAYYILKSRLHADRREWARAAVALQSALRYQDGSVLSITQNTAPADQRLQTAHTDGIVFKSYESRQLLRSRLALYLARIADVSTHAQARSICADLLSSTGPDDRTQWNCMRTLFELGDYSAMLATPDRPMPPLSEIKGEQTVSTAVRDKDRHFHIRGRLLLSRAALWSFQPEQAVRLLQSIDSPVDQHADMSTVPVACYRTYVQSGGDLSDPERTGPATDFDGHWRTGMEACDRQVARIPLNRTARRMLGVLYHRNGNPERAHYHLLAVVTAFQGEGESTGSDFHKISRIYMEAILSRYQLAEVYRSMGRSGEALSQYRRAVVLTERLQLHSKVQSREQRAYLNHLHASILTGIRSLEQATDSDGLR